MSFGGGSNTTLTNGGNAAQPGRLWRSADPKRSNLPLQSNQVNLVGTVVYGAVTVAGDPLLPAAVRERASKAAPWGRNW